MSHRHTVILSQAILQRAVVGTVGKQGYLSRTQFDQAVLVLERIRRSDGWRTSAQLGGRRCGASPASSGNGATRSRMLGWVARLPEVDDAGDGRAGVTPARQRNGLSLRAIALGDDAAQVALTDMFIGDVAASRFLNTILELGEATPTPVYGVAMDKMVAALRTVTPGQRARPALRISDTMAVQPTPPVFTRLAHHLWPGWRRWPSRGPAPQIAQLMYMLM